MATGVKQRFKRGRRCRKGKRAGLRKTRLKCARLGLSNVRIIYWNCASIKQRRPVLEHLVYSADIIALQETQLGVHGEMRLAGFKCFYNRRHLGQVILVRESMSAQEVDMSLWNCDELQLQAIQIQAMGNSFVLVNVYACNAKVNELKWRCLNEILAQQQQVIFCGDFNAKGKSWGNISANKQGEELEDALDATDLLCINREGVTRMASRPGDEDSVIDLAFVSPSMTPICKWGVLGYHGSDHYPCSILVAKGRPRIHRPKVLSFKYDFTGRDIVSTL